MALLKKLTKTPASLTAGVVIVCYMEEEYGNCKRTD